MRRCLGNQELASKIKIPLVRCNSPPSCDVLWFYGRSDGKWPSTARVHQPPLQYLLIVDFRGRRRWLLSCKSSSSGVEWHIKYYLCWWSRFRRVFHSQVGMCRFFVDNRRSLAASYHWWWLCSVGVSAVVTLKAVHAVLKIQSDYINIICTKSNVRHSNTNGIKRWPVSVEIIYYTIIRTRYNVVLLLYYY